MGDSARTSPAPGPRRGRSAAKRAALVQAARDLFLEHGFESTTVDAIAARAGVGKATVYSHFADKQALFEAVVRARSERLGPLLDRAIEDGDADRTVRERLLAVGEFIAATILPAGERAWDRLVIAEAARRPELAQILFRAGPAQVVATLATSFQARARAGELNVPDPEAAAEQFLGLLLGIELVRGQMASQPRRTKAHWRSRAEAAVDTFLARYAAPPTER